MVAVIQQHTGLRGGKGRNINKGCCDTATYSTVVQQHTQPWCSNILNHSAATYSTIVQQLNHSAATYWTAEQRTVGMELQCLVEVYHLYCRKHGIGTLVTGLGTCTLHSLLYAVSSKNTI